KSMTRAVELVAATGTLVVRAGSEDQIFVDRQRRGGGRGRGPLWVAMHDVEIRGDEPRRRRVRIEDGKVTTARLEPVEEGGVPTWVWIAGGVVLSAAAIAVTTYFVVTELQPAAPSGTLGTFELP